MPSPARLGRPRPASTGTRSAPPALPARRTPLRPTRARPPAERHTVTASPRSGRPAPPARQRILDAAEQLFAEHGYDHTSPSRSPPPLPSTSRPPHRTSPPRWSSCWRSSAATDHRRGQRVLLTPPQGDPRPGRRRNLAEPHRLPQPASAMTTITFQELPRHPELRQHALQAADRITGIVAHQLARAAGHTGEPLPAHQPPHACSPSSPQPSRSLKQPEQPGLDTTALADFITNGITGPPPGDPASPGPPPGE